MKKAVKKTACPHCGAIERQMKSGYNRSGTQRYLCGKCNYKYTPEPKTNAYPEDVKQAALKSYYSGVSGRGVGKIFGMSKANVYNWIKKNRDSVDKSGDGI